MGKILIILIILFFNTQLLADEILKSRISVIMVADKTIAAKVVEELKFDADFKILVEKYSKGPGKDKGGNLG